DGILTAYEAGQLDLSKTQLVVLSACETGLGTVKGSEGVYGLQRAFKGAGVRYIMMSLWTIPDEQTAELMSLFYSKLASGETIRKSFAYAQNEMKKKYAAYYWAGFVLVE
ncbi:MAG: CHAT domain-containing protein, partial [Bacteroidetes bacterium]|nr:CHAT domain-containing protein [Bacteroidota bacterium]